MFKLTFNLQELEKNYNTFEEAFADLYYMVKESIKEGTSWQVLETMHWIEDTNLPRKPIMFYDARDRACDMGILVNGKLRIKK